MKFINDYPYTNMTAQNIDWLIKAVVGLIHEGKTDEEIKNAPGISEAYGAFCNAYPYTNMTMQNIDWLISSVRELYDKEATLEENITKIEAQMETLQADVDNVVTKFGDKVDKLNVKKNVYVTDNSTPPKTTGIAYSELPVEGTIPIRDGIGSISVPTAQHPTQAISKKQFDDGLNGKVDKISNTTPVPAYNESITIYGQKDDGTEIKIPAGAGFTTNAIVRTDGNGYIQVKSVKSSSGESVVVNKGYVDTGLAGKVNISSVDKNPTGNTIAQRTTTGTLKATIPQADDELTTKKYVDDAIATAPGGWKTILDKTWTEDETTGYLIIIDIPAEYQKAMSEIRMTYYNDTPQAGAVYSQQTVDIRLHDEEKTTPFMYTGNVLPTQDTTEATVAFDTTRVAYDTLYGSGHYDTTVDTYNLIKFKDSSGNYVEPVPADPNVILNTSKITNATQSGSETGVDWTIDSYLPNRSHTYTYNETINPVTVTYKSNDYYNSAHTDYIVSQVIETSDPGLLPIGSFVCPQRSNLVWVSAININFTSTVPISYKTVVTRQAAIVGESMQVIAGAESKQNAMTSFNDASINGNPIPGGYAYYSGLKNGYPTKIYMYPKTSNSQGNIAKTIYAGSRLIVQAKY